MKNFIVPILILLSVQCFAQEYDNLLPPPGAKKRQFQYPADTTRKDTINISAFDKVAYPCGSQNLFPFDFGISRFTAMKQINLSSNIRGYSTGQDYSYIDTKDYLPNYAFKITNYWCQLLSCTCISSDTLPVIKLYFINDTLYHMTITATFKFSELNNLMTSYNKICNDLRMEYKWSSDDNKITSNGEQIGESTTIYVKYHILRVPKKVDEIEVTWKNPTWTNGYGTITHEDYYELEINWYNLDYCLFDNRGY